ncbi:hypothetical protein V1527DRAFT_458944 [Lipomyces starkeyi]
MSQLSSLSSSRNPDPFPRYHGRSIRLPNITSSSRSIPSPRNVIANYYFFFASAAHLHGSVGTLTSHRHSFSLRMRVCSNKLYSLVPILANAASTAYFFYCASLAANHVAH